MQHNPQNKECPLSICAWKEEGVCIGPPTHPFRHDCLCPKPPVKGEEKKVCPIHGAPGIEPTHYCKYKIGESCICVCICDRPAPQTTEGEKKHKVECHHNPDYEHDEDQYQDEEHFCPPCDCPPQVKPTPEAGKHNDGCEVTRFGSHHECSCMMKYAKWPPTPSPQPESEGWEKRWYKFFAEKIHSIRYTELNSKGSVMEFISNEIELARLQRTKEVVNLLHDIFLEVANEHKDRLPNTPSGNLGADIIFMSDIPRILDKVFSRLKEESLTDLSAKLKEV